ncbi:hypothetical protein ACLOJK_008707 [Asimina triloba]
MATALHHVLLAIFIALSTSAKLSESANFTIRNDCGHTIWPMVSGNPRNNLQSLTLRPGQTADFTVPKGWVGRIWGRTGCSGNGTCETGDNSITLAEFSVDSIDSRSIYDVSVAGGYNLPVVVTPVNGRGNCTLAGCDEDMMRKCPPELAVMVGGNAVGCRSPCEAFSTNEHCCTGQFSGSACQDTPYSKLFKSACPAAYSYIFEDSAGIFSCSDAGFIVSFCTCR